MRSLSAVDAGSVVTGERLRRSAALATMAASGFAGLGYQIVWTQQCALWLGHEAAAVLAVVTAFFGGLAFGALTLGARIERSARPARWYAGCELVIAAWSVVLALLLGPFSSAVLGLTGARPGPVWQWAVAFIGTFLVLLPATAAMGATLPAMARVVDQLGRRGGTIGALYASNTLGAVAGVLGAAFWLVPNLGLAHTAMLCAALNLICAVTALKLFPSAPLEAPAIPAADTQRAPMAMLVATGLLGIGYEIMVMRVISQVTENTVYTFAILLAVYLIGTALGAAAWTRWHARARNPDALRDRLLLTLALACLIGTCSLWGAERLRDSAQQALGPGMGPALVAEAALALAAFGLPTFVMGALFSHLASQARAAGIGFGRALGINTAGAAAAPLLFGVLIAPVLGARPALLLIASGYLLLASRRAWARPASWATAGAAGALALWAPPLVFVDIPEGGKVISYREGTMAAVSVVEDAAGVSRLRIDNRQQEGSSASLLADARQALLPMLLHPAPRRALFLGVGTGVTAASAAAEPTLHVDAVELLPEVIEASAHFTQALSGGVPNPRLQLIAADARRFVRSADARYDLIVSDNFHPARSGSGALYTVEHFEAVKQRLAEGGVFCQWLPLHQLDLATLRSIVRSFLIAYPNGSAMLATNSLETPVLGLVGRQDDGRFDLRQLRARLAGIALPRPPTAFGISDEFALLGSFVAGPRALARFGAGAALNTDDHPVVAYAAPRVTYAPESAPRDRLLLLLSELAVEPAELFIGAADEVWSQRMSAYWRARDRFLEAGRAVRGAGDVRTMLAQVREPLLGVLQISPDFRPAYDPLLRMAVALGREDPSAAAVLLNELVERQPARPEAAWALEQAGKGVGTVTR